MSALSGVPESWVLRGRGLEDLGKSEGALAELRAKGFEPE